MEFGYGDILGALHGILYLRLNEHMIEYRRSMEVDTNINDALLDPNRKKTKSPESLQESSHEGDFV